MLTVHLFGGSIANSVSGNAIWAELWGLRRGIDLAKQLNLSWVIFELDSKVVVDMVKAGGSAVVYLNPLIQEIGALLNHPCWRVSFVHAYREANRCADFLARKGHLAPSFDWVLVDVVCPMLGLLLADDAPSC